MKKRLIEPLMIAGHDVVDFNDKVYDANDDYPDFGIPVACAVASGEVERGILICEIGDDNDFA